VRSDRPGSDAGPSGGGSSSGATETAAASADDGGSAAANDGANAADATEGSTTVEDATEAPSAGGDATDAEPPTPSYDDAPIRATAEDVPGFGPPVTVVALLLVGGLGARRRGS